MTPAPTLLQEAQDPNTSAKRLREVYDAGRNSEAAAAIAAHPNASPYLLEKLSLYFPEAILANPALAHHLQRDRGWPQQFELSHALRLLRFENIPKELLQAFAVRPQIAESARLHVGLTGEAGPDWENEAREALWAVSGEPHMAQSFPVRLLFLDLVPDWLLEPLAAYGDACVRRAVARHPRLPAGLLTPLRRAGSTSDLGGFAPPDLSLPVDVLVRLARGGYWAKRLAARHPKTPPAVLEQLANKGTVQLHWDIYGISYRDLHRDLVRNSNTPSALRELLAVEYDEEFRRASARDPETPPLALSALALNEVRDVRWMAARNPSTPIEALEVLAEDTDARVRQGVGRNTAAPPALLALLAADPVRWVRLAAARHPQTPVHVLSVLAKDEDDEVRASVARRSQTTRPATRPPKLLTPVPVPRPKQFNAPADPEARAKALRDAEDRHGPLAKIAALACPDTSPQYLAQGARDEFWPFRLAVARNPAAFLLSLAMPGADADLQTLSRDGNRLVRAAARDALQKMKGNL